MLHLDITAGAGLVVDCRLVPAILHKPSVAVTATVFSTNKKYPQPEPATGTGVHLDSSRYACSHTGSGRVSQVRCIHAPMRNHEPIGEHPNICRGCRVHMHNHSRLLMGGGGGTNIVCCIMAMLLQVSMGPGRCRWSGLVG